MIIICITGMPGSGKSIVVEAARSLNLPVYTMGDVIREEVLRQGSQLTPDNMNRVARELREKYGSDIVARRIFEKIDKNTRIVVIDGLRSLDEKKYFETQGKVIVIAVHASPKTRFSRLVKRGRPGDPSTWEQFVERDFNELRFGIGDVIALADYMVINEGNKEQTYNTAIHILSTIMGVAEK